MFYKKFEAAIKTFHKRFVFKSFHVGDDHCPIDHYYKKTLTAGFRNVTILMLYKIKIDQSQIA